MEEFSKHLKAAGRDLKDDLGRHLSEDEMVDYAAQRMEPAARERAQSHLARCATCVAAYKDVGDFFEPAREDESAADSDVAQEWARLEKRLNQKNVVAFPRRDRVAMTMAAMLAIALALTAFWSLRLKTERDELGQTKSVASKRADDLEKENQNLRREVAELRAPQLGVPVFDIFSTEAVQRSRKSDPVNHLTFPSGARTVCLILNGEGARESSRYALEIDDSANKTVWRGGGLQRDNFGNFVITLDRSFITPGTFRLRVFGESDKPLAEYVIELRPPR
jgi:hypothetical protein